MDSTANDAAFGAQSADNAVSADESAALSAISALDPGVRTFKDLSDMPEAETFNALVRKGNSLTDAFRLARFDALTGRAAAESFKAGVSRAHNRAHLSATPVNAARAAAVPPETMETYRDICPGLRDEEYRAHYARHNKER
jgi:hypothetical protein